MVLNYIWNGTRYILSFFQRRTQRTYAGESIRYHPYSRGETKKGQNKLTSTKHGTLYAYKLSGHSSTYKVGKTRNLKSREKAYKTLDPNGAIAITVNCKDVDFSEKLLHMILCRYLQKHGREVYDVSCFALESVMEEVANLSDKLCTAKNSFQLIKALKGRN